MIVIAGPSAILVAAPRQSRAIRGAFELQNVVMAAFAAQKPQNAASARDFGRSIRSLWAPLTRRFAAPARHYASLPRRAVGVIQGALSEALEHRDKSLILIMKYRYRTAPQKFILGKRRAGVILEIPTRTAAGACQGVGRNCHRRRQDLKDRIPGESGNIRKMARGLLTLLRKSAFSQANHKKKLAIASF